MKEPIIKLENISFSYQKDQPETLKDINFSINQGEWISIIGPNGSGKSTLARIINCLLEPNSGQVIFKGSPIIEENLYEVRSCIGMVFQNPDNQFVGATVEDDVAFGLENQGVSRPEMIDRVQDALSQVKMEGFLTHEPARLSGGQKQRVAIAGVIALRPDLIILDEATAMLDPQGRLEIIELVKEIKEKYNLTVISITHDIDETVNADRCFLMQKGCLMACLTPSQLFTSDYDLLEMGLDYPFSVQVKEELKKLGVNLPQEYQDEEELLEWITQSYLKM